MNHVMGMAIESLVALLLIWTIAYCRLLNKRLKILKADEQSLKATISELITATEIAERAIGGLKVTVRECDENLGAQLSEASDLSGTLGKQIAVGSEILKRLCDIAVAARTSTEAAAISNAGLAGLGSTNAAALPSADVAALLQDNADLNRLWKHPVIDREDKQAMARQLFGGKIHPLALNLILLLFDKKRGTLVEQVQQAYRERFNAARRRATVKVVSALPLDGQTEESLKGLLARQLEKEVQVETAVDPSLIGGVVLQIEDQVIDNSLRGRLEALRLSLN